MNKVLTIFCLLIITSNLATAQNNFCGTGLEDNLLIRNRMMKNRDEFNPQQTPSGAIKYIPVSYFLSAKTDSVLKVRYFNVLQNLCNINEKYEDQEIHFYLKNIVNVYNNFLFDDPSSQFGAAAIINLNNKNKNAINIFVASKANGSSPGVLAFYNPQNDYIVSDLNYVTVKGTTLAHEIGHYFSLAHTFFGWEADTYDCNAPTVTEHNLNGLMVPTEYVDRTLVVNNKLHCNLSADGFCDTPADYNLGFGWTGPCNYTGCAKDPDEKPLDPSEVNMMSYFLDCINEFTTEQKAAIARDYASTARNYLKTPVHSPLQPVTSSPKNASIESTGFNSVKFKWDAAPNATHYLLEIGQGAISNANNFRNFITTRLDTTLTNLTKGQLYQWRVSAFNFTHTCPNSSPVMSFRNSNFGVATNDLNSKFSSINIKSLGAKQFEIVLYANESMPVQFDCYSLDGRLVLSEKLNLSSGLNSFIRNSNIEGVFTYKIFNAEGSVSNRFLVY